MRFLVKNFRLVAIAWCIVLGVLLFTPNTALGDAATPALRIAEIVALSITGLAVAFTAGVFVGQGIADARRPN